MAKRIYGIDTFKLETAILKMRDTILYVTIKMDKVMDKNSSESNKHTCINSILLALKKKFSEKHKLSYLFEIFAVIIGVFAFLTIYGINPLNAEKDNWIMAGYDEKDIIQHYAGWLAFRNSDWHFPLGLADKMAIGNGTYISFTDSIPWVAIFFKLFRNVLPHTFQYFGIYAFFCYIMQGVAGYKILYYKTKHAGYSLIGTILFCFSPILLERTFRHTALGSHWLILLAIYVYYCHEDCFSKKNYLRITLLEILTIGIHPYFLPMVACFALLCLIKDLQRKRYSSVWAFSGGLTITYFAGCLIGVLGTGISISRDGFGFFSMNLNAIFNPTSCGGYDWSCLFKIHPQILGNYDGFNYLGAGIIILVIMELTLYISFYPGINVKTRLQNKLPIIMICIFLSCFAVSNVITWNEKVLFTIPLPDKLLQLCGIFRASSRIFYPVYYLIYTGLIVGLWTNRYKIKQSILIMILLIILIIQLWDLHYVIFQKHMAMDEKQYVESILMNDILAEIGTAHKEILLDDFEWNAGNMHDLSVWAFKNGLSTYFSVANSGLYNNASMLEAEKISLIKNTKNISNSIIVTSNPETAKWYQENMQSLVYLYQDARWDFSCYFVYSD